MPLIATEGESKIFNPAPEGLHQAVCVDVIDKGMRPTQWGEKHKCQIRWQIAELDPDTGKRFLVIQTYTVSLNEKANLRQILESWRGKKFTEDELKSFDVETVVGSNCQLNLIHAAKDGGRIYANVKAIVPIGKKAERLVAQDYTRQSGDATAEEDDDNVEF